MGLWPRFLRTVADGTPGTAFPTVSPIIAKKQDAYKCILLFAFKIVRDIEMAAQGEYNRVITAASAERSAYP